MADPIMTIHTAYSDVAGKPYNEILVSTIAAYTGYAKYDIQVLGGWKKTRLEGENITYIDKEIRGMIYMRKTFTPKLAPFTVHPSNWDVSHLTDIENLLFTVTKYQQCWIELTKIADFMNIAEPYHQVGYAIPVRLMNLEYDDGENGFKKITFGLEKTFVEYS